MLKVKLQEIARKLAKNSSEIARETGINRNTINALMHNKVDGLKFPTIERLCKTYGLNLTDLLEYQPEEISPKQTSQKYFRQEAPYVPFFAWPWVTSLGNFPSEYFEYQYKNAFLYFKNGHVFLYQNFADCNQMAAHFYKKYASPNELDHFMLGFGTVARDVEALYRETDPKAMLAFPKLALIDFYKKYWHVYSRLWRISFFHDAFDPGFEREILKRIAKEQSLADEEVLMLSSMDEPNFHDQRKLALLELTKNYLSQKKRSLEDFIRNNQMVKEFIKDFGYYKNSGAGAREISIRDLVSEIENYINDKEFMRSEYQKLLNLKTDRRKKIDSILRKHHLVHNPLYFFARMAFLREKRKELVLMMISLGDAVLSAIELQTGIAKKYLHYLNHEEVEGVLRGLVSQKILQERFEKPLLIEVLPQEYRQIMGTEADSIRYELDGQLEASENEFILPGMMASQGYGKGLARIIKSKNDYKQFEPGEIMIAVEISPEYSQLIRQATAVVVEDGNPLSSAAKAAREWGRPCLIGVKDAVKKIESGDSVEVRANHQTVKVIKK